MGGYCTNPGFNELGRGLVKPEWDNQAKEAKRRTDLPALRREDLNPAFAQKIDELIYSAVTHLSWMLAWPRVVQAIRNDVVGQVPSDIMFHNPPPVPQLGAKKSIILSSSFIDPSH